MIPAREDDFIGLAYKISYYITFKFLIHLGVHMFSPLIGAIPYVPLVMALLWVGDHWVRDKKAAGEGPPGLSPITALFFLMFSLAAMRSLDKLPEY